MNKRPKLTALILVCAIGLIGIAGTKISQMTRTRVISETSFFNVVTQDASGRFYSRKIFAPDLGTNLSQWSTNAGGIIAVRTLKTNGVNITSSATSLDLITGSNTLVLATNAAGAVTVQINSTGGGSGGVSSTNENQFGASTTLTIKDGARLTNAADYGQFQAKGGILSSNNIGVFGGDISTDQGISASGNIQGANISLTGDVAVDGEVRLGSKRIKVLVGNGSPEGAVTANFQSFYIDTNQTTGLGWWIKTNGTSTSGWWALSNITTDASLIAAKQIGSAALTNLAGTVAKNVTNVVSLSTSNSISKPLTNSYSAGVLTLYGLEAGANTTITPNGTNLVIASTGGGGTLSFQSNAVAVATENTGNFTNNLEFLWVMTDVPGSRVDIEARLQNDAVAFAKMQNVSAGVFTGRRTGSGVGDIEEVAPDTTSIEITSSAVARRAALTGDVTASAGSATTTIAANAVTDAKFRQSGALSVPGRAVNSAGNVADISAGANGYVLQRTNSTLVWGKIQFTNDYVANAALANVAAGDILAFHNTSGLLTNRPPGGTNYPTPIKGPTITVGVGVRQSYTINTNASFTLTFSGTPLNGEQVDYAVSNSLGASITMTTSAAVLDPSIPTNTTTFVIASNSVAYFTFVNNTNWSPTATTRWELRARKEVEATLAVAGGLVLSTNSPAPGQGTVITITGSSGPATNAPPYTASLGGTGSTNLIVDFIALGPTNDIVITATANFAVVATNVIAGKVIRFACIQDGTGNRTATTNSAYPSNIRIGVDVTGFNLTTNAGYIDTFSLYGVGTNALLVGNLRGFAP